MFAVLHDLPLPRFAVFPLALEHTDPLPKSSFPYVGAVFLRTPLRYVTSSKTLPNLDEYRIKPVEEVKYMKNGAEEEQKIAARNQENLLNYLQHQSSVKNNIEKYYVLMLHPLFLVNDAPVLTGHQKCAAPRQTSYTIGNGYLLWPRRHWLLSHQYPLNHLLLLLTVAEAAAD
ncbi:hypothetical protein H8959_018059 [Pygathrix nigripes]